MTRRTSAYFHPNSIGNKKIRDAILELYKGDNKQSYFKVIQGLELTTRVSISPIVYNKIIKRRLFPDWRENKYKL